MEDGVIPPYSTQSCAGCGETMSNDFTEFLDAGVYARWYTEEYKDPGTGEPRLQEYRLWCCSEECAENTVEAHEGMEALRKVEL